MHTPSKPVSHKWRAYMPSCSPAMAHNELVGEERGERGPNVLHPGPFSRTGTPWASGNLEMLAPYLAA